MQASSSSSSSSVSSSISWTGVSPELDENEDPLVVSGELPFLLAQVAEFILKLKALARANTLVSQLVGAERAAFATRSLTGEELGTRLVAQLTAADAKAKTIVASNNSNKRNKMINTCTGTKAIYVSADAKVAAVVVPLEQVRPSQLVRAVVNLHFATNEEMELAFGGHALGVTFANLMALLEPLLRFVAQKLGLPGVFIIVQDAAKTYADPYASRETGPLAVSYAWRPLIAQFMLEFNVDAEGEVSHLFFTKTIFDEVRKSAAGKSLDLESCALVDLKLPPLLAVRLTAELRQLAGERAMLSAVHPSLVAPTSEHAGTIAAAAFALGAENSPFVSLLTNVDVTEAVSAAVDAVSSRLVVYLRTPAGRNEVRKKLLEAEKGLGADLGAVAYAMLTSSVNLRAATRKAFNEQAKSAEYEDSGKLLSAALRGEEGTRAVVLRDSRVSA